MYKIITVLEGLNLKVCSDGKIYTLDRYVVNNGTPILRPGRLLTPIANGKYGYLQVFLYYNGLRKNCYVHRLVWEAFYGGIPLGYEVDHKDEDPSNNKTENLRLLTRSKNMERMLSKVERDSYGKFKNYVDNRCELT